MSRSHQPFHPVRALVLVLLSAFVLRPIAATPRLFEFGSGLGIHDLHQVSDGGILGVGWAKDLSWIPKGTATFELSAPQVNSRDTSGQAVLLRWSGNLDTLLWVGAFAKGTVGPLRRIRSLGLSSTGLDSIFLSGDRTVPDPLQDGYFIAAIASGGSPNASAKVSWTFDALCPPRRAGGRTGVSQYKQVQAWDVDPKGNLWLTRGSEADIDSAEVVRIDARGHLTLVEEWESHVTAKGLVWRGRPSLFTSQSSQSDTLRYSRLFLKATDGQAPRSRQRILVSGNTQTALDPDRSAGWAANGAGELQRGAKPLDLLFPGPCKEYYHDSQILFADSVRCPAGKGWSGLSASSRATARIGGLIVERSSMRWAIALTWNGLASDGSLQDIPTVMAFDSEGKSLWWSRLRSDAAADTTMLPIDASLAEVRTMGVGLNPGTTGPILVVGARARSASAFWKPALSSKGAGWRNSLDGLPSQGAEASWLGVLTLVDGEYLAGTWQASPTAASGGTRLADPFYGGWPTPGSSGEVLGSTDCPAVALDAAGGILSFCSGDRPLTTPGAFRSAPPPGTTGADGWNSIRLWDPSLKGPQWSSVLDGRRAAGDSGRGFEPDARLVTAEGDVMVVGHPSRASFALDEIARPGWSSGKGDVVVAMMPRPAIVGNGPRPSLRKGPIVRFAHGRYQIESNSSSEGECRWVGLDGKTGPTVILRGGRAELAAPSGSGLGLIVVVQDGGRWVVPVSHLR